MLIKNFSKVITGTTPSTKKEEYYSSNDFMFITPEDLKLNRYIKSSKRYISNYAYNDYKNRFISENSIVIDCIGSDMGNVGITYKQSLTNQQINAITEIDEKVVNPLYLYYLLSTYKNYFHSIGSNGSTMPIISKSLFENIDINIKHNLIEQQHIVDTVGSIDDKIENNNKLIEKYKNLQMLKTNELLLYKTGIIKLSEIITESKEKIKTECTPYSVVNTGNVIKQTEQFNKDIATNIVNKYKAIYYNNFVYNPSRINIGSIGVMQDEIGCVSPIYIVFKCNKDYIFYLEQLFKMSNMIKEINKRCSGSVRQALSYDSLCAIEIFDIQENKLNQYNKKCSIIKENILSIEKENQKLQQLKNNYLAKFF